MPGDIGVVLHEIGVGIASGDVVVDLLAAIGNPSGHVAAEFSSAKRRVVPEEPIALTGDNEGHNSFDMALVEINHAAFQVEPSGRVLAHAVQAFPILCLKVQLTLKKAVAHRFEPACAGVVSMNAIVVFTQYRNRCFVGPFEELEMTLLGIDVTNPRGYLPISDGCRSIGGLDVCLSVNALCQRPRPVDGLRKRGHTNTQPIASPGLDDEGFFA